MGVRCLDGNGRGCAEREDVAAGDLGVADEVIHWVAAVHDIDGAGREGAGIRGPARPRRLDGLVRWQGQGGRRHVHDANLERSLARVSRAVGGDDRDRVLPERNVLPL